MKIISEANPRITFGRTEIFADLEKKRRSGHLGHAMAECADGSILAFYPNCSYNLPENFPGHSMHGWVEYRRSRDRGITWDDPRILPYSYESFLDGCYKIGCEKAVVCDDGTLVVFCLRSVGRCFEPYATPVCILSHDNGETWSDPVSVSDERGRIYDALYIDGRILVLEFCNSTEKGFCCADPDCRYRIFASDDNGQSFYLYSTLEFTPLGHTYGNLLHRRDGALIFYGYNREDEYNLTGLISRDLGKTWSKDFKIPVAKIARNPQVGFLNGQYILHGRSENMSNFVFYHSEDGLTWSEGTIVNEPLEGKPRVGCYYSNHIVIRGEDGKDRMLVQYSEQYCPNSGRFTIMHGWVECE